MPNNIRIEITGDKDLQKNVEQAKKIETSINKAYSDWRKMADSKGASKNIDKTVASLKKLTTESKKVNTEISKQTAEQKKLDRIQKEYNATVKKSNQIQTSYAKDLQKINAKIEVLKTSQKLLTAEGKKTSAQFIRNKTTIKELSTEYRKLEKEELQDIQMKKTLEKYNKKENLTLKQQKELFSALNIKYNKLVTSEGKASRETLELQKRMERLNSSILKSEKSVKLHQRNVGNYPSVMGKARQASMGFVLALAAIGATISRAFSAMKKYIGMANAQSLAETKLTTIMRQRMGATNSQVKSILKLTSAQQKLGVVGDEVQIAGAQQLGTFLKSSDSLKTLIPAMNNLIVQQKGLNGTQQDAVSIANLFGKVMDGQTSALTRVGISLTDAQKELIKYGSETERASVLSQVITDNVGNMNEEFAKTDAGKIQQAKNQLGDLGEQLGSVLLPLMAKLMKLALDFANGLKTMGETIGLIKDKTNDLSASQKRNDDYTKALNKTIADEKVKIDDLLIVARNEKRNKKERLDAIKQLNAISPDYLGNITLENIETGKTIETINKYITALENKTKAQLAQQKLSDIYSEIYDAEVKQAENQIKLADFLKENPALIEMSKQSYTDLVETMNGYNQVQQDVSQGNNYDNYINGFEQQNDVTLEAKNKLLDLMGANIKYEGILTSLNIETSNYQEILDKMGISFGDLTKHTDSQNNSTKNYIATLDIFAQKQAKINAEISAKELEIRLKYKDDSEKIDLEILKFRQIKQIELMQFVQDNNIDKEKVNQNLEYLNITKSLNDKEIEIANNKYTTLYNDYQDYMTKKNLENDKYILELESKGAYETQIEFQKLQDKKELLTDYLYFLNKNANDQNEIERLQIQNQLLDINNQLSDFAKNLEGKDGIIKKGLGLSDEQLDEIKNSLSNVLSNYFDFLGAKYDAEVRYFEEKRRLIDDDIKAEEERIDHLRGGLNVENNLRDENFANTALLTESLIRQGELRIEAKRKEDALLLKEQQKSAKKLKDLQKVQIYAQFAIDNASAISSLIASAFANPLNAPTGGLAGIAQIATGTAIIIANFMKARASIKGLRDGDVLINGAGSETSDDIPAMLSRNESVITAKGSKRATNFLTGLNKDATNDQLMQMLQLDFGLNSLRENNIIVNFDSYELKKQNEKLTEQINETRKNNVYLSQLLNFTKNKPDYVPLRNGYKKISQHGETSVIFE